MTLSPYLITNLIPVYFSGDNTLLPIYPLVWD